MSDDILIITDASGNPFGNREINLFQLEKMGYKLDENKEKLNMQKLSNIALVIYKSETHIQIVSHTFCGDPKIKGPRPDRYYFLYNVSGSGATADILTTLKQFTDKANEEIKKYGMEIKEEETTHYPFRDITNVVENGKIPPIKEDLLNAACECLDRKQSIQLEAHSIEKVIPFLINLDSKRKYCTFIIYISPGILEGSNVNIFINKNIEEIELSPDIEDIYLFNWEEIPGNDSERFTDFLKSNYDVDWVKTAKIAKTDNGKRIMISSGNKLLSLNLNTENTKLNLKIDNGKTDIFIVKTENGKLNIYENIVRVLERIKDDVRQKDRVGAKKKIESLLNMAGN